MRYFFMLLLPCVGAIIGRELASEAAKNAVADGRTLVEARQGFKTKTVGRNNDREPAPTPPSRVFRKIKYDAPSGKLTAYLTPNPNDGQKHSAIVWITGGDCNSIGDVWSAAPASNDQTASAFRKSGVVMMFPSLRGGNDNPGEKEGFLGEVDDVIAAADFLARYSYVDPDRIYLGGHSTGGTLVLLAAECSGRFRAVFSFGPVDDVSGYPPEFCPFDQRDAKEVALRSPGRWLPSITSPTFVFEGTSRGNVDSLNRMARNSSNGNVHFYPVRGADHFSIIGPVTKIIAKRVVQDSGPTCNLTFDVEELARAFGK